MAWGACRALAAPGGGSPMAGAAYALSAGLVSLLFAGWLARTLRRRKADSFASAPLPPAARAALALTWGVVAINVLRLLLAAAQAARGEAAMERESAWDTIWLVQSLLNTAAEAVVVAYLLLGHAAPGGAPQAKVAASAGAVAVLDAIAKAVAVYALTLPLFVPPARGTGGSGAWAFWAARDGLAAAAYGALASPRARQLLPARPAYPRYAAVLAGCYSSMAAGSFILSGGSRFGYCLYGGAGALYSAGFPPLLFLTFVAGSLDEADAEGIDLYSELDGRDLLSALEM